MDVPQVCLAMAQYEKGTVYLTVILHQRLPD